MDTTNRWGLPLNTVLLVAGLLAGCASHDAATPRSSQTAGTEPVPVNVVMREFKFEPDPLKVAAGRVRFLLRNLGTVDHDFLIADVMHHAEHRHDYHFVKPGQSKAVEVNLRPGTYEAVCTVPGHKEAGMKVTVQAGPTSEH